MNKLLRIGFIAGFVLLLIIIAIIVIAVVAFGPRLNGQKPDGTSTTTASVNVITPGDQITGEFKFAAVRADDTVAVRNSSGKEIVINLEHKKWQKPLWSPDGKTISALANNKEGANIPDLFLYDVTAGTWKQVTFFEDTGQGISSYLWRNDENILFVQGQQPDMWLHNYRLSDGELTKIFRVNGKLQNFDESSGNYLFESTLTADHLRYELRDPAGTVMNLFDTNEFAPGTKLLHIIPTSDLKAFLLLTFENINYKVSYWQLADELFRQVILLDNSVNSSASASAAAVTLNFLPVCSLGGREYLGYYYGDSSTKLSVINFDAFAQTFEASGAIETRRSMALKSEFSVCHGDTSYLAIDQVTDVGTERRWYEAKDGKLVRLDFNYAELAVR